MLSGRSRFENKVINALTKRSLLRYKTNNKINMKVVILADRNRWDAYFVAFDESIFILWS